MRTINAVTLGCCETIIRKNHIALEVELKLTFNPPWRDERNT